MLLLKSDKAHPSYLANFAEWRKWRLAHSGGPRFKEEYLHKYDTREDTKMFAERKERTYNPPVTRKEINKVKDHLVQHMAFVQRIGGGKSYQDAICGHDGGVDKNGRSMHDFFSEGVIVDFLVMSKVAIFVNMPADVGPTKATNVGKRPNLIMYRRETIINWSFAEEDPTMLAAIVLQDAEFSYDDALLIPNPDTQDVFRCFKRVMREGKWQVQYDVFSDAELTQSIRETKFLDMPEIPCVILEMPVALLQDVADMQIALLNLASADVNYCYSSNFVLLTEQQDTRQQSQFSDLGEDDETRPAGPCYSLIYSQGCNAPAFISPSIEPLTASTDKQKEIERQIRETICLGISDLSADTSVTGSLPGGLAALGAMLERAENKIAYFWSLYEGEKEPATVIYPKVYSVQSDEERSKTSETLQKLAASVPSITLRREITKLVATTVLAGKVSAEVLDTVLTEIDTIKCFETDAKAVGLDVENGLVSKGFASQYCRGYPKGEADKAAEEHLTEVTAIAAAQMKNVGPHTPAAAGQPHVDPQSHQNDLAARGLPNVGGDASAEKQGKPVRGDGKTPQTN